MACSFHARILTKALLVIQIRQPVFIYFFCESRIFRMLPWGCSFWIPPIGLISGFKSTKPQVKGSSMGGGRMGWTGRGSLRQSTAQVLHGDTGDPGICGTWCVPCRLGICLMLWLCRSKSWQVQDFISLVIICKTKNSSVKYSKTRVYCCWNPLGYLKHLITFRTIIVWRASLSGVGVARRVLSRGFLALPHACFGVLYSDTLSARDVGLVPRPTGSLTARVLMNGGSALPRVSTSLLVLRQWSPGTARPLSHRLVSAEPRALTATRPLATPRHFPI